MNILLLGSGGREHALAWKMSQSPLLGQLWVAPGNAGTNGVAENVKNVNIGVNDFEAIKALVLKENISIVVVGPEEPLVRGISDFFKNDVLLKNVYVVGPSAAGAMLEGSKAFSKGFMARQGIPTAAYREVTELQDGIDFMKTLQPPYVLKADGLAAGKGVLIVPTLEEASADLGEMLGGKFGAASSTVVIEEFLSGIEFSVFVLTNGTDYKILPIAKDYKRIGEGDTGLNTGGMGAVSPVPFVDAVMMEKVENRIIRPTMEGFKKENIDYVGFVFIGLISVKDEPFVIEYNCRMGDPETEVVMPRLKNDLVALFEQMKNGTFADATIVEDERSATTIMLVAGGYPNEYRKGDVMQGFEKVTDTLVFHAGTTFNQSGEVVTNGGRVLALTSYGESIPEALQKSNDNAKRIDFEGKYYRKDIGLDLSSFAD